MEKRTNRKNKRMPCNWPDKWHQKAKGYEKETEKSN